MSFGTLMKIMNQINEKYTGIKLFFFLFSFFIHLVHIHFEVIYFQSSRGEMELRLQNHKYERYGIKWPISSCLMMNTKYQKHRNDFYKSSFSAPLSIHSSSRGFVWCVMRFFFVTCLYGHGYLGLGVCVN